MNEPLGEASPVSRPGRLALGCAAGVAFGVVASWARYGWERTLWLDTGTTAYVVCAFLLGAGLAVAGVSALRLQRLGGALDVTQLRWGIVLQLVAFPALALTSLDLFSNVAYGQLQLLGRNPYLEGPRGVGPGPLLSLVTPRWADTPSAYGPISSLVSRIAAAAGELSGSMVWGGGAAFKVAMAVCAVATIWFAYAAVRRAGGADAAGQFGLLAFSPLLAWELSAQAHNDALLVLALMIFVWAASSDRQAIAVIALTAGVLSKAPAAPLLLLHLAFVARQSRVRAVALTALATVLAAILVAPYWHGLATLRGSGTAVGGDVERHAHSLADLLALVLRPLSAPAASAAYWFCWAGSLALCVVIVVWGLRRATSVAGVVHSGLVLFLAYCLTTPWFQPWYVCWLLPLAVLEPNAALRRVVALYAVLTVVQWILPLDPVSTVAVNGWVAVLWWRAAREPVQRSSQDAWRRTGAAPVI